MKTAALALFVFLILWAGFFVSGMILAEYGYSREIGSYWNLAEKASSLEQKVAYLDRFVAALESAELDNFNAIFLETPDNSLQQNMVALRSLQVRLHQIRGMEPTSFEYQQAIFQITQQEQGEARAMLAVFEGCWTKRHYFFVWDWFVVVHIFAWIGLFLVDIRLFSECD